MSKEALEDQGHNIGKAFRVILSFVSCWMRKGESSGELHERGRRVMRVSLIRRHHVAFGRLSKSKDEGQPRKVSIFWFFVGISS